MVSVIEWRRLVPSYVYLHFAALSRARSVGRIEEWRLPAPRITLFAVLYLFAALQIVA